MPDRLTNEALDNILDRERQKHRIPTATVRLGELSPAAIDDILSRRNRRVQRRISGPDQQSRRRQCGGGRCSD